MDPIEIVRLEVGMREACNASLMLECGPLSCTTSEYEAETELMARASEKRRREFYSGRQMARNALLRSGGAPCAIYRGKLGNPIWPSGYLGSITHDHQWCLAAVVTDGSLLGIGIDLIEHPESVSDDLADMICTEADKKLIFAQFPHLPPIGLAFSLKESVAKAISVLSGRFLDFLEIRLTLSNGNLVAMVEGNPHPVSCRVFPTPFGLVTFGFIPNNKSARHNLG